MIIQVVTLQYSIISQVGGTTEITSRTSYAEQVASLTVRITGDGTCKEECTKRLKCGLVSMVPSSVGMATRVAGKSVGMDIGLILGVLALTNMILRCDVISTRTHQLQLLLHLRPILNQQLLCLIIPLCTTTVSEISLARQPFKISKYLNRWFYTDTILYFTTKCVYPSSIIHVLSSKVHVTNCVWP